MRATQLCFLLNRLHLVAAAIRLQLTGRLRHRTMRLARWSGLRLLLLSLEVAPERSTIGYALRLTLIQTVIAAIVESDLYRFKRAVLTAH